MPFYRRFCFVIIYSCYISAQFNICAQIGKGGIPYGFQSLLKTVPTIIEMPAFNNIEQLKTMSSGILNRDKSFHFAKNFQVDYSPSNCGTWEKLNDGTNVWQVKIISRNAKSIGLVLNNFKLLQGEKLFIYNSNEILGAFTIENNLSSFVFPVMPIKGESVIIEFITTNKSGSRGTFYIETVAHGFENIYDDPGPCEININCPIGDKWQIEKRSVCKLIIYHYAGDAELCTGSLINNTANDSKPYVFTANHCIFDQSEADRMLFMFNYESPTCDGTTGQQNHVLTGANVRATLYDYDFTLLEMKQHPPMPFKPYYSGWSLDTTANLDTVTTIHHPWGGVKKIAIDTLKPLVASYVDGQNVYAFYGHWQITKWDTGVTERGSSGAPLFDKYHRVIGSLSGGDALCGYPFNDYFERLNKSYSFSSQNSEQLKYWLDPYNSGITHLNGLDPFPDQFYGCDTISNIGSNEKTKVLPYEYGKGYYSGTNSDSISQFAEYFESKDSVFLTGVNFNVNRIGTNGGITIHVIQGNNLPGKTIYETYISYKNMQSNSLNYFEFYPEIKLKGNFFISYGITYSQGDTFSIYQAAQRVLDSKNTAFLFVNGLWKPLNQYTAGFWGSSFDIRPIFCNAQPSLVRSMSSLVQLQVYPNPANISLKVILPDGQSKIKDLEIIDISGRRIPVQYKINRNIIDIDLKNQTPGFYVINVKAGLNLYFSKFFKQ